MEHPAANARRRGSPRHDQLMIDAHVVSSRDQVGLPEWRQYPWRVRSCASIEARKATTEVSDRDALSQAAPRRYFGRGPPAPLASVSPGLPACSAAFSARPLAGRDADHRRRCLRRLEPHLNRLGSFPRGSRGSGLALLVVADPAAILREHRAARRARRDPYGIRTQW